MKHRSMVCAGLLGMGLSLAFTTTGSFAQNNAPSNGDNAAPGGRRIRLNREGQPGQPGGPGQGGNRSGRLAQELNLTPEQRQKFDAETFDFQEKMRALREEHERRLSGILTPEQLQQYRSRSQGRGGPGGPGGGPGGPGGGGRGGFGRMDPQQMLQRMKTELNLTAAQETQIGRILQDGQTKMEGLRATMQQPNADRQAIFGQMQAIRQAQNEQINAVLTPEQRTKWQTLQPNRGPGGGRRGGGQGGPGGPGGGPANSL
ncbi:MAG: hypothetical protein KY468_06230 [Armatimonadetes bacterium]|nr:hypothetical protein [Armatimonadota bacterium]